ncbi:cytochrome P450 [Catenaria anguillulae PL171]|uniref:Cytochrome P450 n=1 Tax=Catenaria anguillulae PL171 TaxID=765915 RepID=A0A1Y2H7N8_9FUNG|nr:cytochrome P450 [Catenaria anguillulae PL171]
MTLSSLRTELSTTLTDWLSHAPVADEKHLGYAAGAAAVGLATVIGTSIYRATRVPPELAHLPSLTLAQSLRVMLSRKPFLEVQDDLLAMVRENALERGLIKSKEETPRLWVMWFFGSWVVTVANPTDMKTLLTDHQTYHKIDLAANGLDFGWEWFGKTSIFFSNADEWKRYRRSINPSFRRGWSTDLFAVPGHTLLTKLDAHATSNDPIPISNYMQRVTLDALSLGAFGRNLDSLNNPHSHIVNLYNRLIAATSDPAQSFLKSPLIRWAVPTQRQYLKDVKEFNAFIEGMIKEKEMMIRAGEVDPEKHVDLLTDMVRASLEDADESQRLTRDEVRVNTVFMFVAGHDTTSNTMSFVLYLLALHPEIQAKARAEIIAVLGDLPANSSAADTPYPTNAQQQSDLPYLTNILKETMRLYSAVNGVAPRKLVRATTLSDGTQLPAGAILTTDFYAVHRAQEYWGQDALAFKPDRWEMPKDKDESGVIPMHPGAHDFKWMPFGGGQRICIGQNFSIMEQRVIISMLLLRYEWSVIGDEDALRGKPKIFRVLTGLVKPVGLELAAKRRGL